MNKSLYLIISIICICLIACDDNDDTGGGTVKHPADRTVLVYMAGENSLTNYLNTNVSTIVRGAANGNLNGGDLLIYIDRKNALPCLIKIEEDASGKIIKDTVKVYQEQNSVDINIMRGVIDEVIDEYPANSYGLILSSHGTAWLPSNLSNIISSKAFGQDGDNWMEINDLKKALPDNVFDFIIFDACYMSSVEVVYALKNKANYILASATEIMGYGLPYDQIIAPMFSSTLSIPDMLKTMGGMFYNYYDTYTKPYNSGTIALTYTPALDELVPVARKIVKERQIEIDQLNIGELQQIHCPYNLLYDLDEFISVLAPEDVNEFRQVLDRVILYNAALSNAYYSQLRMGTYSPGAITLDLERFCGMNVYVPQQSRYPVLYEWYKDLDWYKAVYQ